MLAGVGPFAIEEGLVAATGDVTRCASTWSTPPACRSPAVQTPGGAVEYDGDARIDGVPGTAAPVPIDFLDIAGSSCGALLPTGNAIDGIDGVDVTCIDNGMPVVVMRGRGFRQDRLREPEDLEADADLKARVEAIRLAAGPLMNLGDVTKKTVPKMMPGRRRRSTAAPSATRNFIPHRVHEAIGVFGAVSVATACVVPGSVAALVSGAGGADGERTLDIEHPTGFFSVAMDIAVDGGAVTVKRAALLRTCRKLMSGEISCRSRFRLGRPVSARSIALIGFGEVGQALAQAFAKAGSLRLSHLGRAVRRSLQPAAPRRYGRSEGQLGGGRGERGGRRDQRGDGRSAVRGPPPIAGRSGPRILPRPQLRLAGRQDRRGARGGSGRGTLRGGGGDEPSPCALARRCSSAARTRKRCCRRCARSALT